MEQFIAEYIKLSTSNTFPIFYCISKASLQVSLGDVIPLLAASHDTIIGRKQAEAKPISHTSWIFPNRESLCPTGLTHRSGDSSFKGYITRYKKHTHEAGCLKHSVLFDRKGLLRASGLPHYWSRHTQAQTGQGVCLNVNKAVQHTLFVMTCRASEFNRSTAERLANSVMTKLFFQPITCWCNGTKVTGNKAREPLLYEWCGANVSPCVCLTRYHTHQSMRDNGIDTADTSCSFLSLQT